MSTYIYKNIGINYEVRDNLLSDEDQKRLGILWSDTYIRHYVWDEQLKTLLLQVPKEFFQEYMYHGTNFRLNYSCPRNIVGRGTTPRELLTDDAIKIATKYASEIHIVHDFFNTLDKLARYSPSAVYGAFPTISELSYLPTPKRVRKIKYSIQHLKEQEATIRPSIARMVVLGILKFHTK